MNTFAHIVLVACAVWAAIELHKTNEHLKGIREVMANINETLAGINARLTEASTEILALIEELRNEQLTPAGREALAQIEAKANALADIVPNPTPVPPPEP